MFWGFQILKPLQLNGFQESGVPLFSDDGSVEKVIINFVEITNLKRLNDALQNSEEKIQKYRGIITPRDAFLYASR